jgi:hypothetical protein
LESLDWEDRGLRPALANNQSKMEWRCGSSGRVLALQTRSSELNLPPKKKKKYMFGRGFQCSSSDNKPGERKAYISQCWGVSSPKLAFPEVFYTLSISQTWVKFEHTKAQVFHATNTKCKPAILCLIKDMGIQFQSWRTIFDF